MDASEQQPEASSADTGSRARPDGSGGPPAKRRKKATEGEAAAARIEDGAAEKPIKKEKACHACRRVKLRCVVEPGAESCRRCSTRNEECVFTTPLHDLKWQKTITARVEHLDGTLEWLVSAVGTIAKHLKLDVGAPPVAPAAATASLPSMATPPPSSAPSVLCPAPAESNQGPSRRQSLVKQAEVQQGSPVPPLPRRDPGPPEIDIYTQEGAEQLLAQAYANSTFASPFDGSLGNAEYNSNGLPSGSHGPRNALDYVPEPSFFGLLDFQFGSPELSRRSLDKLGEPDPTRPMAARLLGSTNLEAVGSSDPRTDVVKTGLVSPGDAEVLLDFFHAHLAPHFLGFPLQLRSWPYLPAGKSTITPLILGAICLISAERIPAYHETASRLATSDLGDSILNATAGLSWAPPKEGDTGPLRGREGAAGAGGEEPDLDLELGIGPEEISALLIYASFSSSPRSDAIARCAFEWTRGYLKTFMLPSPPPVTYGEVFGLLPARRDLTFENWLRLWLFGYIVDVQQSLHHESRAPVFDPNYFCDTLLLSSSNSTDPAEQQRDRELVAHARLCALLQRIQYTRMSAGWSHSTAQELIQMYDSWNTDLRDWWTAQNFLPTLTSAPPTSPTLQPDIALTLFRLFASIYINLAAAKETRLADDASRWGFRARSVSAAYEMLGVVGDEGAARVVNVLFPFYIKMISLAAVVLLDGYRDSVFISLPCTLAQGIEAVARVAENLANAPVPSTHVCFSASTNLRRLVSKTEQALKRS